MGSIGQFWSQNYELWPSDGMMFPMDDLGFPWVNFRRTQFYFSALGLQRKWDIAKLQAHRRFEIVLLVVAGCCWLLLLLVVVGCCCCCCCSCCCCSSSSCCCCCSLGLGALFETHLMYSNPYKCYLLPSGQGWFFLRLQVLSVRVSLLGIGWK